MGKKYSKIPDNLTQFIKQQKVFFVGTAAADGRVNISPKGLDSLRIIDANRVLWLSVTGSGNETSAHVQQNPRMTIMFIALEGNPMILRLYGSASIIHKGDPDWEKNANLFGSLPGARQIFNMSVDLVHTSCGMGVPFYEFIEERQQLNEWANKKGEEGIKEYWREKNQQSLDGKKTHIVEKNI
jgi:hypothetical protein